MHNYLSVFAKTMALEISSAFLQQFDIQVEWKLVFKSHQLRLNNDKFIIAGDRLQIISLAEVTVFCDEINNVWNVQKF